MPGSHWPEMLQLAGLMPPPRDLHAIDAELKAVEKEIAALLDEVAE